MERIREWIARRLMPICYVDIGNPEFEYIGEFNTFLVHWTACGTNAEQVEVYCTNVTTNVSCRDCLKALAKAEREVK